MAGAVISILPILALYLLAQKLRGPQRRHTGLKGDRRPTDR